MRDCFFDVLSHRVQGGDKKMSPPVCYKAYGSEVFLIHLAAQEGGDVKGVFVVGLFQSAVVLI